MTVPSKIGNIRFGGKITKERYISPEKRQHIIDELRLIKAI